MEQEKRKLDEQLGDAGFYAGSDPETVRSASQRCVELAALLAAAEERWLELQEELEAIGEP